MNPNPIEKRREIRRPGQGTVRLRWNDPKPFDITGRLVDVSDSGFRMSHGCRELISGQVVEFSHVEAKGHARVVWTRILAQEVETGFVIVGSGL